MKAIVIEGAQGASEYQFWDKLVIEKFNSSQESKWGVYPAGGCGNIFHVLDSLASLAKKDYMCDHIETDILICYDTTVNSRLREDFLADYNEWITNQFQAELNGLERVIRFHLVSYYCFEDCLLLSNNLLLWVYSENRRKKIDGMLLNSLKEYKKAKLRNIFSGLTGGGIIRQRACFWEIPLTACVTSLMNFIRKNSMRTELLNGLTGNKPNTKSFLVMQTAITPAPSRTKNCAAIQIS